VTSFAPVTGDASTSIRRARIQPRRGGEEVLQERLASRAAFIISVAYDPLTKTIGPNDRAINVDTGAVYDIRSALNMDERKRAIDFDATAVQL
jgi:hypothetical protein